MKKFEVGKTYQGKQRFFFDGGLQSEYRSVTLTVIKRSPCYISTDDGNRWQVGKYLIGDAETTLSWNLDMDAWDVVCSEED